MFILFTFSFFSLRHAHLLFRSPTRALTHTITYSLADSPTHSPTFSPQSLTRPLTHLNHALTDSLTHLLTHSRTRVPNPPENAIATTTTPRIVAWKSPAVGGPWPQTTPIQHVTQLCSAKTRVTPSPTSAPTSANNRRTYGHATPASMRSPSTTLRLRNEQ